MPAPVTIDRQAYLANLRQSGLLSDTQLAALEEQVPESARGRAIARTLVERGLLTKFQAEQLLAGRTGGFFLGQYRILDLLGQGGMGRVFKAQHLTMKRIVALKVLSPNLLKTGRAQELFLREVRTAAQLAHPNIVTAHDANQVNGRYYLVLEFIDGPNLDQLVRDQGPLPIGQACDYIRQIALGLQHAHQLGMVHRDMKPANVLVQVAVGAQGESYGVAKISDFGLARWHNRDGRAEDTSGTIHARANVVMGTPDYLAPEQARDVHQADIRSDLYSLGCTFHYLLTGQAPFPGGSTMEKVIRHSTEPATPVEALRPDVPPAVAAIVRRLMAKDPAERFQTPAELVIALAPYCVSGPAHWSGVRQNVSLEEGMSPVVDVDLIGEIGTLEDRSSALNSTLPPALSPTPQTIVQVPVIVNLRERRQFRLALYWSLGIVGALLAIGGLVALLAR